jgi:hypothetical protein
VAGLSWHPSAAALIPIRTDPCKEPPYPATLKCEWRGARFKAREIRITVRATEPWLLISSPRQPRQPRNAGVWEPCASLIICVSSDADIPGCRADDDGENDRGLTASDVKSGRSTGTSCQVECQLIHIITSASRHVCSLVRNVSSPVTRVWRAPLLMAAEEFRP